MQEITVFALLLFVALYAFAVYIEFLKLNIEQEKFKLNKMADIQRLKLEILRRQLEDDANGRTGRDLDTGQFTSLKKSKKAKKIKKLG